MIAEKKIDVSKLVSNRSAKLIHFFISGASSGLGLSLYSALSKKNFLITVIGRCAPINLRGKDIFLFADLSSEMKFKYKINKNVSKVIFLSNAGTIDPVESAEKIDINLLKSNHNVNFFSPFLIASELVRATKQRKVNLHIVNISSGAASRAIAGWSSYCSSKAAIKIALDCIAAESNHVTVDHIDPGVLDTNMQQKIRSSEKKNYPNHQYFTNLHQQKLLKKPVTVAAKIVNQIGKYLI